MVSKKGQTTPLSWGWVVSAGLTHCCATESMEHEPRNSLPHDLTSMLILQEAERLRPRRQEGRQSKEKGMLGTTGYFDPTDIKSI